MIACSADETGQILTITYSHAVKAGDVRACLKTIRDDMPQLRPGFVLLSDLTSLDSMDPRCAEGLGEMMELCCAKGMAAVIRVIPDPGKDIGFNLISLFHCPRPVRVYTRENLADAIKCLLLEESPPLRAVA